MAPASIAVVDLGSNSTRLLIADVGGGEIEEIERRSMVTRLAQDVDATARLADEAIARVFEVLEDFRKLIDRHGADTVVALATSAVRDSQNGDEFRAALKERYGFDTRTISGDEEARLTFLGATSARSDREEPTLVIDIGGGSTELVVGRPADYPDFHVSTQAGSVRQTERHLRDDPPTPEQVAQLRREVRDIFGEAVPAEVREGVRRGIAVAGTATQLAAVDLALDRDGKDVHGHILERAAVQGMLDRLGSAPLEERRQVRGLDPARAPTIVAGAAILAEAIAAFGLGRVETSTRDILHGAALFASATDNGEST